MNKHIFIIAIALVISAMAYIPVTTSAEEPPHHTPGYSAVINPSIPNKFEFCGKKVDLTRTDMWERFDRELTSVIYTHGNTLLIIKRANKYFPEIMPILQKNGVPSDIVYLACVESMLNHRAYSPAKAAGIWQFIASTAKEYGLEVNDEVDERYNLEKSTAAAARLLKSNYNKFGNWESAMAAYNGGRQRIINELADQLAESSYDIYLTEETSRYPFRIMATKAVMENPAQFGFHLSAANLYQPVEYDVVEVSGAVDSWPQWAKDNGITYSQLREANPWIRAKKLTNKAGKTYQVKIPKKSSLVRSASPKVYNPNWVK